LPAIIIWQKQRAAEAASIPKKSFTIPQSSWTDGGSDTEKERDKTKYYYSSQNVLSAVKIQ
jgi:hypothetical protein